MSSFANINFTPITRDQELSATTYSNSGGASPSGEATGLGVLLLPKGVTIIVLPSTSVPTAPEQQQIALIQQTSVNPRAAVLTHHHIRTISNSPGKDISILSGIKVFMIEWPDSSKSNDEEDEEQDSQEQKKKKSKKIDKKLMFKALEILAKFLKIGQI